MISLVGGISLMIKTVAFRYEMAGRLGIIGYFSIVFGYIFDYFFIGTKFTTDQAIGIFIILAANVMSGALMVHRNYCTKTKE